jgi:hypothetical protein
MLRYFPCNLIFIFPLHLSLSMLYKAERCSFVVERLPSMCKALDSISITTHNKAKERMLLTI